MIKNLDSLIGFIQLGVYLISLVSAYWVMKSDIKLLRQRIDNLEKNQNKNQKEQDKKWDYYEKEQKEQNSFLQKMMSKFEEVSGDIKEIKTDLSWLKKK